MKIGCFSVAAMDFFSQQKAYFAGGNSLNQAIRFAEMGFESSFVGAIGRDDFGDKIFDLLKNYTVDVSHTVRLEGETAHNVIINDEAGERFGVEGAWNGGVYDSYSLRKKDWDFLTTCDMWSTHANGPNYEEALRLKQPHQKMFVDFLHLQDYELLERSLNVIDVAYFGGTIDMQEDLRKISAKYPAKVIVLTLGGDGSVAFSGNKIFKQEALPVEKVIDTTGCGDAFQAGFSAKYFETGDVEASLLAGAEQGKKAAMHFGGVPWK